MTRLCARATAFALALALGLSACRTRPPESAVPAAAAPPTAPTAAVPEVIPRVEPRSRYGNPPFYDVFGKRYYVLSSSVGYWERGVASWYGPGFHKVRTSNGEAYDMYGMTAAHKTLPLPAYVRVTNLQNGRSVVVRVNDRGPFVGNRIIDLSYTAALKLDMLRNGTAIVDVRSIDPAGAPAPVPATALAPASAPAPMAASAARIAAASQPAAASESGAASSPAASPGYTAASPPASSAAAAPPATTPAGAPLFVQAGAFSDPANADRLVDRLRGGHLGSVFVRTDQIAGRKMYRVRIGPVPDVAEFDRVVAALERAGVKDAHLALD